MQIVIAFYFCFFFFLFQVVLRLNWIAVAGEGQWPPPPPPPLMIVCPSIMLRWSSSSGNCSLCPHKLSCLFPLFHPLAHFSYYCPLPAPPPPLKLSTSVAIFHSPLPLPRFALVLLCMCVYVGVGFAWLAEDLRMHNFLVVRLVVESSRVCFVLWFFWYHFGLGCCLSSDCVLVSKWSVGLLVVCPPLLFNITTAIIIISTNYHQTGWLVVVWEEAYCRVLRVCF